MSPEKIEFLSAVLIISENPERLAAFYKNVIGLPLKTESHGDTEPHYGCELGDLHFAIHPAENFPDQKIGTGSVRLAFTTFDIQKLAAQIEGSGYYLAYPIKDQGFAKMTALHDPDGNYIEFTQLSERWFKHLEKRKSEGHDIVQRWKNQ